MVGTVAAGGAVIESPTPGGAVAEDRRLLLVAVVGLCVLYAVGLAYYATVRPVDGDEGFYTTAARFVWEGKTPYRDFFYQQAPLLPYLYAWIYAIHPSSLIAMRLLSVAFGSLAVSLWGICLISAQRIRKDIALALFAVVLLNPYWAAWNVVVKTYAAANLFMSATMICLYLAVQSERSRWYFSAGVLLGLCTSVRSLYGTLVIAVLAWVFVTESRGPKFFQRKSLIFLAGAACGLSPMLWSFLSDPGAFIFNNIQYHRLDAGYLWDNGKILVGYRSLGHTLFLYFAHAIAGLLVFHPFFTIQVLLAVAGALSWRKLRKEPQAVYSAQDDRYLQLTLLMIAVFVVTSLIPFPPYEQYFDAPLTPFLIPFVAEGLRVAFREGGKQRWALAAMALFLVIFEVGRESAWNSMGPQWRFASYRQVSEVVKANSQPNEMVLSFWPGYVFESGRRYFPGLENNFSNRITSKVSSKERVRYHLVSCGEVTRAIAGREARLLVFASSNWMQEYYDNLSPAEKQIMQSAVETNYRLLTTIDGIAVYRLRSYGN